MPDPAATLSQVFEAQAQKYGARAFLKDKPGKVWTDHSFGEISDAVGKLRAGLPSLGVRPGDRVAILSDNCPGWIVVDQAVLGWRDRRSALHDQRTGGDRARHQRLWSENHRSQRA